MKNLWQNDTFLKVFAVVTAFLCWIYIVFITNPEIEVSLSGIPVTLSGHHAIKSEGYIVSKELNTTVDVRVKGTRKMLANLSRNNIIASVDLSNCADKKSYDLPVNIKLPYQNLTLISKSIETVSIEVDNYITHKFHVEYVHNGKLKDTNYYIEKTTIDANTVEVSGPETIVKTIEKAIVNIDINGANDDVSGIVPVTLLNSSNNVISTSNLDIKNKDISYNCLIFATKEVPVEPSANNDKDYNLIVTDHPTITLIGPASDVDSISVVKTKSFTITDGVENYRASIIVPEKITVDEDVTTVNILVEKK